MLASSYHFIENSKFWPPFWLPFDPRGLENGVCMGNRSWYKAILKKNLMSNKKCWEINLSKIIQKILVLDLSITKAQ